MKGDNLNETKVILIFIGLVFITDDHSKKL